MNDGTIKKHDLPCEPEWKIILNYLVSFDQTKLYRICRKMIIYLDRKKIPEISYLMEELNPYHYSQEKEQIYGQNWPKPKGSPFIANDIVDKVFAIADEYIKDSEISQLLSQWILQENLSFFTNLLENAFVPLIDVVEAIKRYISLVPSWDFVTINERIGIRVALIIRFLSDNLSYINLAKHYITIVRVNKILDRVYGPSQGKGKLGGKSAGLILARQVLRDRRQDNPILNNVTSPKTRFLTSDGILEFLHYNALEEFVFVKYQTPEETKQEYPFLEYIFKNSHFPPEAIATFNKILDDMTDKPIIVRSSSLLEDSFEASFSGKYKSLFLANKGTREERLSALKNAIAEVYASTFAPDPIEYRKERGLLDFGEEMGILIQEVVGTKIGKYYLPSFAGVAFSINEFRWSPRIKREDGVVRLVAGLGTRAVDRTIDDYPTLVCPGQPGLKVNTSYEETLRYSQQYVDVINLETNQFETIKFSNLIKECKGNFPALDKLVSFNRTGTLVDPVSSLADFTKEDLIITFNNLINNTTFINEISSILFELQKVYERPVDIEFASDGEKLYILQCRPLSHFENDTKVIIPKNISNDSIIFSANHFISNGIVEDIDYVVYVVPTFYSNLSTSDAMMTVGKIIGKINRILKKKKFILIGPGRWGSKGDIKLGVPVLYSDINNTAMLIEVAEESAGFSPELSFGTHFFQDLVEANIKYLPLYPGKDKNIFNSDFFMNTKNSLPELFEEFNKYNEVVRIIKVDDFKKHHSLSIYMDGDLSEAIAYVTKKKH